MLKSDVHLNKQILFLKIDIFQKDKFFCQNFWKIQDIWESFWSPEDYLAHYMPKTGIAPCFPGKKSTTKFFSKRIKMPFFCKKWSDQKNSLWVVMLVSVVLFWCMNES